MAEFPAAKKQKEISSRKDRKKTAVKKTKNSAKKTKNSNKKDKKKTAIKNDQKGTGVA